VHLTWPTDFRLTALGAGSQQGTIALLAIAAAGIVYCYGTRWIRAKETVALWAIPALALAYLPLWALSGDRVVMAEAALAAALFGYRRTRHLVSWLPEGAAALIACGFWATGAVVAIASSAPLDSFGDLEWAAFGGREGLAGLASLVGAAAVLAWSVRTPARPHAQYALLLPFATLAYLIAEAVTAPHAFWAWLAVAAVAAACVHVPELRRRLGEEALQASAVMMFSLGVAGGWAADDSLRAFVEHGRSSGWETILLAALAGLVVASSFRDLRLRSYALWAPFGLLAQLSAMLLPGQYAVVAWAALSSLAGLLVCLPPRPLRGRLDLAVVRELSVLSAAGVATVVLFGYERPDMLFQSNRTPASGLAAAAAATVALFLAAAAARRPLRGETVWTISGMRVWSALVYAAGAAALWTLSAAILGAVQFTMPSGASSVAVHDRFQNGHVLVSISWALVGLALVVVSLRGERRRLRVGGIALLFVALGKLFLYDLAYLDAMARAISFIVSGAVLLLAALLLQRFAPHVKAALVDEDASTTA